MYTLYTHKTPNGLKPLIMLEELKQTYKIQRVDISKGEQFHPDFAKISPNNKIPVLFDESAHFHLFESVAILIYLAEKHQQFLPIEQKARFVVLQWCFFQAAHIGPMFGQYAHFHRHAPEVVPYAQKRYADEVTRLLGVLEHQLKQHDYIAGADYSIADMAIWTWVDAYQQHLGGQLEPARFTELLNWHQKIGQREAVNKTLTVL